MLQQNQKAEVPVCGRCRKIIEDVCYAEVSVAMVLQSNFGRAVPQIFYNKESAENYAQHIPMHPVCWIETLKDHGVNLHDITKIMEEAKKKAEKNKPQQKQKKKKRRTKQE